MGATFTPGQVALAGRPGDTRQDRPYMSTSGTPSNVLGAETVRATGSGPFDAAYRQNLANYEGGLFARPGGNLSINPTGGLFGNPTGGGNAPVPGLPTGLLDLGLAGMGFTAPQQQSTPDASSMGSSDPVSNDSWKFWLDQFGDNGSMFNKGSTL